MIKSSHPGPPVLFTFITLTLLLSVLQSCAGPSTLRKDGLSFIQLGDPMPAPGSTEVAGHAVSEAQVTEEGYSWRVCTLAYEQGRVLLESDFTQQQQVNRIRVETPELRVKGGLQVNDPWSELLKKTSKWIVRPYPKYKLIEATSPKFPRKVFLLQVDGFDYAGEEAELVPGDLPGDAKVVGIVLL